MKTRSGIPALAGTFVATVVTGVLIEDALAAFVPILVALLCFGRYCWVRGYEAAQPREEPQ